MLLRFGNREANQTFGWLQARRGGKWPPRRSITSRLTSRDFSSQRGRIFSQLAIALFGQSDSEIELSLDHIYLGKTGHRNELERGIGDAGDRLRTNDAVARESEFLAATGIHFQGHALARMLIA